MSLESLAQEKFKELYTQESEISFEQLVQLYVEKQDGERNPFLIKEYTSKAEVRKNETVIYTPGGGGDGTLNFELNYIQAILEQGYDVITIRHCGLNPFKVDGRRLLNLNQSEIQSVISKNNQVGELNYVDWSLEPLSVLEYVAENYPEIKSAKLIGHSYAGMSNRISMYKFATNNPASTLRISNVVELSPANYSQELKWSDYEGWEYFFESLTLWRTYNGVQPAEEQLSQVVETTMRDKSIRSALRKLYPNTNFAVVIPAGDTYVSQDVGKILQHDIPNGVLVVRQDYPSSASEINEFRNNPTASSGAERNKVFKENGGAGEIHDGNQLTPKQLIDLLEIRGIGRTEGLVPNTTRTDKLIGI